MTHPDIRLPADDGADKVDESTLALAAGREPVANVFRPMLLFSLAIVSWLAFVAIQEMNERAQLTTLNAALLAQDQEAVKLRSALQSLTGATSRLADAGNTNARAVLEELRRRGVTIRPDEGGTPASAATPP